MSLVVSECDGLDWLSSFQPFSKQASVSTISKGLFCPHKQYPILIIQEYMDFPGFKNTWTYWDSRIHGLSGIQEYMDCHSCHGINKTWNKESMDWAIKLIIPGLS